jgi:hypothetical protein
LSDETKPPDKALQRTRISAGYFPWRSPGGAELGRQMPMGAL